MVRPDLASVTNITTNHPTPGYKAVDRCADLIKGVKEAIAKEAKVARSGLPKVALLSLGAVKAIVANMLTAQFLDDLIASWSTWGRPGSTLSHLRHSSSSHIETAGPRAGPEVAAGAACEPQPHGEVGWFPHHDGGGTGARLQGCGGVRGRECSKRLPGGEGAAGDVPPRRSLMPVDWQTALKRGPRAARCPLFKDVCQSIGIGGQSPCTAYTYMTKDFPVAGSLKFDSGNLICFKVVDNNGVERSGRWSANSPARDHPHVG